VTDDQWLFVLAGVWMGVGAWGMVDALWRAWDK